MRVIKNSKFKRPRPNTIIKCRECECEFEVESKELKNFKLVFRGLDYNVYEIPCPECKYENTVETPPVLRAPSGSI